MTSTEPKNVYLLSGLGADSRAFGQLKFSNKLAIHHLSWIKPEPLETMHEYAGRLSQKIDSSKPFVLIGLSFGGMLASEMNTFLKPERVILLSSVNSYKELPIWYKLAGWLNLHHIMPSKPWRGTGFLLSYLFGIKHKADKVLLNDVIANTNPVFSRWAIRAILKWKRAETDNNVIRIHGTRDRVLPITGFKPNHLLKNAGHLMVIDRAKEVSELINQIILKPD